LKEAGGVCEICRDLNLTLADKLAPIYRTIEIEYARTRAEFEWRKVASTLDATGRLWFDDRLQTLPEVLESLTSRRDIRLDYLAGVQQIGATRSGRPFPTTNEDNQARGIATQLSCR
jgi:hypothetical protein